VVIDPVASPPGSGNDVIETAIDDRPPPARRGVPLTEAGAGPPLIVEPRTAPVSYEWSAIAGTTSHASRNVHRASSTTLPPADADRPC